jgi:hypothetical protein
LTLVIVVAEFRMKSSAASISIAAEDGRVATAMLASGSLVLKKGAAAQTPLSKSMADNAQTVRYTATSFREPGIHQAEGRQRLRASHVMDSTVAERYIP